jgi:hypothetical protein
VLARAGHAAALLPANGDERERVLIAGGEVDAGGRRQLTGNGLVFDTQTEAFVLTNLALSHPRKEHTLTVAGGRALVAGGSGATGLVAEVEVFEGSGFAAAVPVGEGARSGLRRPRVGHSAVPALGGVLILGGSDGLLSLDDPEWFASEGGARRGVFDVRVDGSGPDHRRRSGALAGGLGEQAVLFAGGVESDGFGQAHLDRLERFELAQDGPAGSFIDGGSLPENLAFASSVTLGNGMLLFCGGWTRDRDRILASDEVWIYNPPR